MKIICFGKNGQVANALSSIFPLARFISSGECDFIKPLEVQNFLQSLSSELSAGDVIINAAAYTKVDLAEDQREEAININAASPALLAEYCRKKDIILVHISTDYVFEGKGEGEYEEKDADGSTLFTPCNFYGVSKLAGERAIVASGCMRYIIRTSWVYSRTGSNFFNTISRLLQEKKEVKVINDQIGSPTFAADIANTIKYILINKLSFGTYHFTNGGFISWFDFASKIRELLKIQHPHIPLAPILPIKTSQYETKAQRPYNSRLKKEKLQNIIVPFEDSLEKCILDI